MPRFRFSELRVADSDGDSSDADVAAAPPAPPVHRIVAPRTRPDRPPPSGLICSAGSTGSESNEPPLLQETKIISSPPRTERADPMLTVAALPSRAESFAAIVEGPTDDIVVYHSSSSENTVTPLAAARAEHKNQFEEPVERRSASPPVRHPSLSPQRATKSDSRHQPHRPEDVPFTHILDHRRSASASEASLFFEEVAPSQAREGSLLKPCAVVLDDGREATPDAYLSDESLDEGFHEDTRVSVTSSGARDQDSQDRCSTDRKLVSGVGQLALRTGGECRSISGASRVGQLGVSLYRQRLLERQVQEERRQQLEVEQQLSELTFRPNINPRSSTMIEVVHATPYYLRLHAEAARKSSRVEDARRRLRSLSRERPAISENSRMLVEGRDANGRDVFNRLFPEKPRRRGPSPRKQSVCGNKDVFERLSRNRPRALSPAAAADKAQHMDPDCSFKPQITQMAQKLLVGKDIVQRLYTAPPTKQSKAAAAKAPQHQDQQRQ